MIKQISIKTRFGWISALENNAKIFEIKFGKLKKQTKSPTLSNFKKNLFKFLNKKKTYIKANCKIEGNKIQKKIWSELSKIKKGKTKLR